MNKIFRTIYSYGNKEILLTTTRSLRAEKNRIGIDEHRFKNELQLYANLKDKGFASITTALAPIIIANPDQVVALSEACNLYQLIRKKISRSNRIGITLLCHLLWNPEDFEEKFSSFTMLDSAKEDEIEFQKQKINIILGKRTIVETILENLDELEKEKNEILLKQILSPETVINMEEELLKNEKYFLKLCNFEINPPELKENFAMENILGVAVGGNGTDPLIGPFTVVARDEKEIIITSKRGELNLMQRPKTRPSKAAPVPSETAPRQAKASYSKEELIQNFAIGDLSATWQGIIHQELEKDYFYQLLQEINGAYQEEIIYPEQKNVFRALQKLDYKDVKVVILGQDPYHGPRQANGLCFSVGENIPAPPSLQNIFKELEQEYGQRRSEVDLSDWAEQGVLLINAVLTVKAGQAGAHANKGWEKFTDQIIQELNKREEPLVFLLWGNYAIRKAENVDKDRHLVLTSPHPSPLSAHRGFLGNKHFIQTNQYLKQHQIDEIKWI